MALSSLFVAACLLCAGVVNGITPNPSDGHWIDNWATMPQLTEAANLPNPPFNQTGLVFPNSTIRQTIRVSLPANQIRLKFSNNFGLTNLPISAVTVALPKNGSSGTSEIQTNTLQTVTFSGGETSFSIPNGALAVSDPLNFPVKAQSELAITMYLEAGQTTNDITSHPGSRATTWFSFGNHVGAENLTDPSTQNVAHWYFISAVEAWVPKTDIAFSIVGDSITDGRASDTDGNDRWPDLLLDRMSKNAATKNIAIANQAAGGNRILADGLGPNAFGRIERDVISHSGIKFAMIFEGVNDIGTANTDVASQTAVGDQVIAAFKQIVARVHAVGLPMFAATITPFSAPPANASIQPYSNPEREKTRQRVNAFIRDSGLFDAVMDFDAVVRDPQDPSMLAPNFNSGDFLHPNVAGYTAIANSFPLDVFEKFANGVSGFT
ncbi:extracellular GDSL-like lipase/acylhydrolase [Schizopora paradoxa]|uniref:Extracellular GDSL-like lipase/acylhydrolase n=1 Tax=Schizopora paradoxa TaxID=27342 RepID=A0A0H2S5L0_9AGAM|nr:extracellular GDSL-like lipase/acylhydrolase [Schizopora paradoxa]